MNFNEKIYLIKKAELQFPGKIPQYEEPSLIGLIKNTWNKKPIVNDDSNITASETSLQKNFSDIFRSTNQPDFIPDPVPVSNKIDEIKNFLSKFVNQNIAKSISNKNIEAASIKDKLNKEKNMQVAALASSALGMSILLNHRLKNLKTVKNVI